LICFTAIQLGAINCFKEKAEAKAKERDLDEIMRDKLTLEELSEKVSQTHQSLDEVSESLADVMNDLAVGYYALSTAAFSS
jgi:uncharacterized alpha-E superfamily protein